MSSLSKHILQLVGIAKGWALANLPGWSDDSHRDLLARHGGRRDGDRISALTMTVPQLQSVLADYERRGWPRVKKAFTKGQPARRPSPAISHMFRLWGRLGQAGKVGNPSREGLLAFCARQISRPVPNLDSLSVEECQAVIESLKAWLVR